MSKQFHAYIDSCNRENGSVSSSNFKHSLYVPRGQDYKKVGVVNCNFPKSYYMVDSTNLSIPVVEDPGGASNAFTLTITPNRNYTSSQLASEIKNELEADNGSTDVYTVTVSSTNGKFTISNDTRNFSLDFSNNKDLAKYLGFSQTVHTSTAQTLIGDQVADLQRYNVLFLRSSVCNNGGRDDILQELNVRDTANFDLFTIQPSIREWRSAHNPESNSHDFSISDVNGNNVNLNGSCVQVSLVFEK